MAETPSSGSGVDIASLGIQVDATQPAQAAEALDQMTRAADGAITSIDRLADASKGASVQSKEYTANATREVASTEELVRTYEQKSRAIVRDTDLTVNANAAVRNRIQALREQWDAEQAAIRSAAKLEAETTAALAREDAARHAFIVTLKEQVAQYNLTGEALLRYKAQMLGVAEQAEVYIAQMEAMRIATEKYGVTITEVGQIEKVRAEWEATNMAVLNAQRNRYLAEKVAAEKAAEEEIERNATIFQAFKIRTMMENRAEAMRILTEQEETAVKLAEKQAIEEIRWNEMSVKSKIAQLERLQAYQANRAISPETINSTFGSAAINDLQNLSRYQKEYADAVEATSRAHSSAHAPAKDLADGLSKISFESSRARSEVIVLGHEFLQGRFSKIPGSLMVLMEYTNAASLAFTGLGVGALAALVGVGAVVYEMSKGATEVYQFNNAMQLTAGYSGMTRDSLESMAESLKGNVHGQIGTATDMLIELNKSGKFTSETLYHIADAALNFQRVSGKSTEQVAAMFEQLGTVHGKVFNEMQNKVADWAAKQNESYHFLNAASYERIRLLALEGRNQEAMIEIADRMNDSLQRQDKNVGYLMASYLGFKMIIQDIGHAMREWGKTDTTGQLLEAAKKQLQVTEAVAQKYQTEDAASPTPGKSTAHTKYMSIAASYASQIQKVVALEKQYREENEAADKKSKEKQVDQEGVFGQREVDAIRVMSRRKTDIADQYIDRLMQGAAFANASLIQEWNKGYHGEEALREQAMQKDIASGKLKVETEETLAKTIADIRARYHNRETKGPDDGRYQALEEEIQHQEAMYKKAEKAESDNIKLLDDAHKAGTISDDVYYATLKTNRQENLMALEATHNAEISALQRYNARTAVEKAKIAKQISQINDAYDTKVQEVRGKIGNDDQDEANTKLKHYKDIMEDVAKAGIKETDDLDKRIEAQKKHNEEIGKTAEKKELVRAKMEEEEYQQNILDAAYLQGIIDQGTWDDQTTAVFTARLVWLQRAIDKHKELNDELNRGAKLEAQAKIDKDFDNFNKKLSEDIYGALADGGGRGLDKLIRDMKKSFANLILRPIIQPISQGITSMFFPDATQAGGSAGGGGSSMISMANTAATMYKGVSAGVSGVTATIGNGISTVGSTLGSSTIAEFGSGFSGSAAAASEAMGAPMTSAATAGSIAASAAVVAAGLIGGHYIGGMISGGYGIGGHEQAVNNTGTVGGAVIGAVVGGPIGAAIGAVIGGAIGGLVNRAFGMKDKEIKATGLEGTLSDSGVTGDSYSKWHQDGGWFRSDKDGKDTSAFDSSLVNSFTSGLTTMKASVSSLASTLGIGNEALAGYSKTFDILIDPLKEVKGNAAEQAQIMAENDRIAKSNSDKITEFFTTVGDDLTTRLIPNIKEFSLSGETASATLERLNNTFKQTDAIAAMLGKTSAEMFGGKGLESDAVRERLVNLAGGSSNLNTYTSSYAQNFLNDDEKRAPVIKAVSAAMTELGYASVDTREEFKATVSALDLTKEADAKLFVSLMQLQDAFATAYPAADDAAASTMTLADAKSALKDAYDAEVKAVEDANSRMKAFSKTLRDMADSSLLGDLSPLTPEQKYAEAKSQFDAISAKAKSGDEDAQGQFQSAFENFLSASRTVNASGAQYQKDFDYAQSMTKDLDKWATQQVSEGERTLSALNKQVDGIIEVNKSVMGVTEAINKIAELMGKPEVAVDSAHKDLTDLYQTTLNRAPDQSGLDYWTDAMVNHNMSITEIAHDFSTSNEAQLRDLYQSIFHREADTPGLQYWNSAMANGVTIQDVANEFRNSDEYKGLASQSSSYATTNPSSAPVVAAIADLTAQVVALRTEQSQQTGATITGIAKATEDSAVTIAAATKSAVMSNYEMRVQPA